MIRVALVLVVVCASAAAGGRTIARYGEPCRQTCVFPICVGDDGAYVQCPSLCDADFHVTATRTITVPRGKKRTKLVCLGGPECVPCNADDDCDDEDPRTRDLCLAAGGCTHICPNGVGFPAHYPP